MKKTEDIKILKDIEEEKMGNLSNESDSFKSFSNESKEIDTETDNTNSMPEEDQQKLINLETEELMNKFNSIRKG
jgi:hypothetical protein